jgi:hypothetical protein
LNAADVHVALEWQKRWTTYEEEDAGVVASAVPDDSDEDEQQIPSYVIDREQGARNPSPGKSNTDDDEDEPLVRMKPAPRNHHHNTKTKRQRETAAVVYDEEEEEEDPVSDLSSSPQGFFNEEDGQDHYDDAPHHHHNKGHDDFNDHRPPMQTEIVRPVAIRAGHSHQVQQLQRVAARGGPPAIIQDEEWHERPLSPLTLYSQGSSQGASHPTSLGGMMVSCNAHGAATTASHHNSNASVVSVHSEKEFSVAREGLLNALASSGGDADDETFQTCLQVLEYSNLLHSHTSKGMWLTLTKPTFFGCLGTNDEGDPLYTLARMSFDMFTPGDLICSLQGNFNEVYDVPDLERSDLVIPKSLVEEVKDRSTTLKTYKYVYFLLCLFGPLTHTFPPRLLLPRHSIITAFTIEPTNLTTSTKTNKSSKDNKNNKTPQRIVRRPIRCTMTTSGYMIPDPNVEGRDSVWITGGRMEPNATPEDTERWNELFPDGIRPPHEWAAAARLLAVKWLMGAELSDVADATTGAFSYQFTRPLGGHGLAYIDTLYMDASLRIVRGHRGTIFCFARVE